MKKSTAAKGAAAKARRPKRPRDAENPRNVTWVRSEVKSVRAQSSNRPSWSPGRGPEFARLAYLFSLAGEPNRLLILRAVGDGDGTADIKTICERLSIAPRSANQHFMLLKASRLVAGRKDHKHVFYSLTETGAKLYKATAAVIDAL